MVLRALAEARQGGSEVQRLQAISALQAQLEEARGVDHKVSLRMKLDELAGKTRVVRIFLAARYDCPSLERNLKEELSKQKEELSVSQVVRHSVFSETARAEAQATAEELKKLRGEVEKRQQDSEAMERQQQKTSHEEETRFLKKKIEDLENSIQVSKRDAEGQLRDMEATMRQETEKAYGGGW
eukprot:Skav232746  [mRNA]  locus=scaffold4478:65743:70038:+ [translate_table: standard]